MIQNLQYWFYKYITGPTQQQGHNHWRMSEPDLIKFVSADNPREVYYTLRVNKDTEECVLESCLENPLAPNNIRETFSASDCLKKLRDMNLLESWDPERSLCHYTDEEIKMYTRK